MPDVRPAPARYPDIDITLADSAQKTQTEVHV